MGDDNSEEQCLESDSDSRHQADDSRTSSKHNSKPGDNNSYHSSGISDDEDPVRKSQNKMDILPDSIDGAYTALTEPISKSTSPKYSNTDSSSDDEITNLQAHHKQMSRIPNADNDSENNSVKDKPTCNISDDDPDPYIEHKKNRLQKINSGSESDMSNTKPKTITNSKVSDESSDEDVFSIKHRIRKSRIQTITSSDDGSSNDGLPQSPEGVHKNAEQQARMKNKINKLKNKFDILTKTRQRDHVEVAESERLNGGDLNSKSSDNSDEEIESIMEIKKSNRKQQLESLCDPDTSDEEHGRHVGKSQPNKKHQTKKRSTMLISPKPQVRMSAKQALDNMKKIRSESNRLLREKEVSLPYHRPKALSLKDIMSRSKPAVMADGKAMPLKMNEQQLKQYAQMLDERQKEMMVLCKSDSDDEEPDESNDLNTNDDIKTVNGIEIESNHLAAANENSNMAIDSDVSKEEEKNANMGKEKRESENIEGPSEVSKIDKDVNDVAIQDNTGKENNVDMETDNQNQSETTGSNLVDADKTVENNILEMTNDDAFDGITNANDISTVNTEQESQLISLHYDSEKITTEKAEDYIDENNDFEKDDNEIKKINKSVKKDPSSEMDKIDKDVIHTSDNIEAFNDGFSDDDIDMQDIDRIIENADIISENQVVDSPMLIREAPSLKSKPKLIGAPGMVIDLDGTDAAQPKKLSGVELLKERFSYFAKLKTPQEMERTMEKSSKPGTLHFKLKHEMEDEMANQRTLEWEKRLEEEKQQHLEMNAIRGDADDPDAEDDLDDIEKMEAKLAEIEPEKAEDSCESEEELVEDDMVIEDKPKKKNPLITDEAEESDCVDEVDKINRNADEVDGDDEIGDNEDEESSDEESSDEEVENEVQPKKGRIRKAFEDSDEEDARKETNNIETQTVPIEDSNEIAEATNSKNTEDDELPSAQFQKSISEDIFASQDTDLAPTSTIDKQITLSSNEFLPDILVDKSSLGDRFEKMPVICETQSFDEAKLDEIVGMCSGSFSQPIATQPAQPTQTQEISDDVLALCTGQFYDNQFITQVNEEQNAPEKQTPKKMEDTKNTEDRNVLKSILDELDGPDFAEKPKKFFCSEKENDKIEANTQKKRLVIDSDDEDLKPVEGTKKKRKKKRLQDRALQISDDEEDLLSGEESAEDYMSDLEDEGDMERVIEYDSEENEVQVQPRPMKKKRKASEFFEQEAELSSEDEWVGSGDEDEAGLDRMEREAGDDDKFNQARLQRELGEIHMRDVLDQDKRDVRLLQELLFEDGDLGTGHRQRKFRWRTEDGEEGMSSAVDEFGDTQEEEFESEEMWRKQRHEREVFLRQMQQQEGDASDTAHVIDRSALIKANLTCNRDVTTPAENQESSAVKKLVKDIPSPVKKPFSLQQLNMRGSLLARGDSALARLGALAAPLAGEAPHALKPGKRNFVFAAVSPTPDDQPKVTKRKISSNPGTPQLMKKLKIEDKHLPRSSLLDHMKA